MVALLHEMLKQLPEVGNSGLVLELEASSVVEVLDELAGEAFSESVDGGVLLLVLDLLVLLLLVPAGEALPGEFPSQKVHEHVAESLQVVSPRLLVAEVSVEAGVSSSAGQVLPLLPRDVLSCLRVPEPLGETEVDEVDVGRLLVTDQKVVWLHVSMNEVIALDEFYSLKHLYSQHQHCFQ